MNNSQLDLEIKLCSFDSEVRREALYELSRMLKSGQVALVPEQPIVNLHSHTFFSFNAYNYSPSSLVWEAKKRGLYAIGIMDHEVLDGIEEFIEACDLVGLRGLGGLETRVFIPEWCDVEINMPGEQGVFGFLGSGFLSNKAPSGSESEQLLQKMSSSSNQRNKLLTRRLNEYLGELTVDYEREVLPLTPSGMSTERHILVVLESKARKLFPEGKKRACFWAKAMSVEYEKVFALIEKRADLQMLIRSKLMKKESPCFVPVKPDSFPGLDESVRMMRSLGAVPIAGWLDGTSEGEKDAGKLLDFMMAKGVPAVSIIPDRNWNIKDETEKKIKVEKLHEVVKLARERKMFCVVGTDMSKLGQKFVDDFTTKALEPLAAGFLKGANIMIGHTRLIQYLGFGLSSPEAEKRFHTDLDKKYNFFEKIGRLRPAQSPEEHNKLKFRIEADWQSIG